MAAPHITEFYAENVKRLKVVRITPDGRVIQITGANGSGKTSVLDALWWALAGKSEIDPQPMRRGAETAVVSLALGDVKITREWKEVEGETKTELRVEAASGARFPSPQRMLDDLVGTSALSFDPLAFDRMSPKEQLVEMQRVAPLPADVHRWEAEAKVSFDQRTEISRKLRDVAGEIRATGLDLPKGYDPGAEEWAPLDTAPLKASLAKVGEQVAAIGRERQRREAILHTSEEQRAAAAHRREHAARLLAEAEDLEARATATAIELDALPDLAQAPDSEQLTREIARAEEENRRREKLLARAQLQVKHDTLARDVELRTKEIESRNRLVAEATAAAEMPVPGLAYGREGVLYQGLPLEQASSAERLRVSLAIAMAKAPKLRVVRIKDGSLLDQASLALIAAMAAERDYQVWIERVDTTGKVGIVMEDGEVATVNPPQVFGIPVVENAGVPEGAAIAEAHERDAEEAIAERDPLEHGSLS
jgi:hypothetical protein